MEPLKAQVKRWLIQKYHSIMVKSPHVVEYYFFQFDGEDNLRILLGKERSKNVAGSGRETWYFMDNCSKINISFLGVSNIGQYHSN